MLFKRFFHKLWHRHRVFLEVLYKESDLLGLNRFSPITTPTGYDRCHSPGTGTPSSWSHHFSQHASATPLNFACPRPREETWGEFQSKQLQHMAPEPGGSGRWHWSYAASGRKQQLIHWHGHHISNANGKGKLGGPQVTVDERACQRSGSGQFMYALFSGTFSSVLHK